MGDITAVAWSPNGALLASAGADRKVLLWDTKTQKIIARLVPHARSDYALTTTRYDYSNVMSLAWHPTENTMSFTNTDGELFIYTNFVPSDSLALLGKSLPTAPFIHDPLAETSANARRPLANASKDTTRRQHRRGGTPDSLDDILGSDSMEGGDDFLEDDDGAGYASEDGVNGHGKRGNGHLDVLEGANSRRRTGHATWSPRIHASFQPGSTPWRGNRRYLCKCLVGLARTC